jgi:nucleotide-binding universal stress UspA family protein
VFAHPKNRIRTHMKLLFMNQPTREYKRILVPVEDFQFIEVLVDFISDHRWSSDVQFKILHVVSTSVGMSDFAGMPVVMSTKIYQEELQAGQRLANNLARRLDLIPKKSIEAVVEPGEAKEVIIRYAKEWPSDLILMVSHGRHGLDRWLMGSVTGAVADQAPCSIIILHAKQNLAVA